MAQILGSCFEGLGRFAHPLAKSDKRLPEAMRVKIGQARPHEGVPDNGADRRGVAAAVSVKSGRFKMTTGPPSNSRPWEKRIVQAPKFFYPQIMDPIRHDLPDIVPYREKVSGEGLAEFRLHLAGVLFHFPFDQVDMFSLHRSDGPIPRPGE
jgi:hypothetical protein